MKYFAEVDKDNIVINTIIANDDFSEKNYIEYSLDYPAGIGYKYIEGYFYPKQPYPSWTKEKGQWIAPVPMPDGIGPYRWNEENGVWEEIS